MVSTLKENPNGGFYCSECRMSTSEPVTTCPFCGSIITNWEDIMIKRDNSDFDKVVDEFTYNELDHELLHKVLTKLKVSKNEDNIH